MINNLKEDLRKLSDKKKAELLSRFFKTGKGQYGYGDIFLGITVPNQRKVSKKYKDLSLKDIQTLLLEGIHEYRLTALLILVEDYKNSDNYTKKQIFEFYLKNTKRINNWDLVDLSAPRILGSYLFDKDRKVLYDFAKSENIWEKRISIISTLYFISKNDFKDALKISKILLSDKHDLIHKAVGWMLREIGKRNQGLLEDFLNENMAKMPRTTLRYAIERFDGKKRKHYLNKPKAL